MSNTGGTAFPVNPDEMDPGMTLRDYFAARAMEALLRIGGGATGFDTVAKQAYSQADEMLKARPSREGSDG